MYTNSDSKPRGNPILVPTNVHLIYKDTLFVKQTPRARPAGNGPTASPFNRSNDRKYGKKESCIIGLL
jgi:hypothetical protein